MTKEERIERLRALLAEGHTVAGAAVVMRVARAVAHKDAAEAGLVSSSDARAAAMEKRRQALGQRLWGEAAAEKRAAILAIMEARRAPGVSVQKLVAELGVSDTLALKIWGQAHPGERYFIPVPGKPRDRAAEKARREQCEQSKPAAPVAPSAHGEVMRNQIMAAYAQRAAVFQQTARVRDLGPVSDGEAADAVARFFAKGGRVTLGPTVACAPVNNGRGF